jgi:hypothetical protein
MGQITIDSALGNRIAQEKEEYGKGTHFLDL